MGFRLGKYKNKIIALLLILSILVSVVSFHPLETRADNNIVYSYYDWLYSVAKSQGYEMKWIDPEHCDYPATSKALALTFQYIDHKLGLYGPLDNYDPVENLKVNLEDIAWYFKSGISRMTEEGIYLTSEAWDAFKQFFSDVANDKECSSPFVPDLSYSSELLNDYIRLVTGLDTSGVSASYVSYFLNKNICVIEGSTVGNYKYYCIASSKSDGGVWHLDKSLYDDKVLCWSDLNEDYYFYNIPYNGVGGGYYGRFGEGMLHAERIIAVNWMIPSTVKDLYSPYIKYTPTGSAPAQVPDIIPWSTFPDHEVIEDDTKIYIPVESPGEETPTETPEDPTETPEQPTETPEEPTETPGDSDDGDDITNLVPIFPDIDIDPDIHLPDDWINPPDIDLDPDVDVDTPSPGGKIPHLQKLKEKFPFCIPFDLVLLFKMLNKKPKAPKWEFKHDFQIGDSKPYTWEVVVDMADYDKYVQIFREGFFLLFLVGLFFVTKKLISWQTG